MCYGGLKFTKYAAAIVLATLWGGAQAAGTFSVLYGQKSLEKSDWEPLDSQSELGFLVTFQQPDWPLAFAGSYLSSEDSYTETAFFTVPVKITAETTEVSFGIRKNLSEERVKVFVEGGLASISAKITVKPTGFASSSDSDSAMGFWFGAGLDAMVGDSVSIGGLVRLSSANVTLGDVDVAAGGTHFGLYAAYHFQ